MEVQRHSPILWMTHKWEANYNRKVIPKGVKGSSPTLGSSQPGVPGEGKLSELPLAMKVSRAYFRQSQRGGDSIEHINSHMLQGSRKKQ